MRDEGDSTLDRAWGRWREILPQLAVDAQFLQRQSGRCPLCGGADMYTFSGRDDGRFACVRCGSGNAIALLRRIRWLDYPEAIAEIETAIAVLDIGTGNINATEGPL